MKMKSQIAGMIAMFLMCGFQYLAAQQTRLSEGHFFLSLQQKGIPAAAVEQHLGEWFDVPAETEWRELSRSTDQLGMTRIEYKQYVGGVEVAHAQVIVHVKDGKVTTANGTVMESHRMPSTMRRSSVVLNKALADKMGQELCLFETPDGYRYATKTLSVKGERVYTDVETNQVLGREPLIRHFDKNEGEPVSVAATGLYLGDVTIDVTKTGDTYHLYDSKRNIYTISGNKIPSIEQLFAEGKLSDYIPKTNELPAEPTEKDFGDVVDRLTTDDDLTDYIMLGGFVNSTDGKFCDYRVKSIHIDLLKGTDEQGNSFDFFDQSGNNMVRLQLFYGETECALYDGLHTITGNSLHLDNQEKLCRLIPAEGVRLVAIATKITEQDSEQPSIVTRQYTMRMTPDESGLMVWENDDAKVTLTYEKSPVSPIVDIHAGMERTYDYYKNVFGRDSYDDHGAPIYNLTYLPNETALLEIMPNINEDDITFDDNDDDITLDDDDENDAILSHTIVQTDSDLDYHLSGHYAFSTSTMNAFAVKGYKPFAMMYGLGGTTISADMRPLTELSILCHEFTHLVTGHLLSEGNDETGALNESFSDIMAISMVKTDEYGYGKDSPWIVGGRGMTEGVSNLRDLADPANCRDGKEPGPTTYMGTYWYDSSKPKFTKDASHTNCSVQNYFYYLLCEGGSGTNDNGDAYQLTGIGLEKSRQIAYRTLTQYATESSRFADIRLGFIQSAKDLYGEGSEAEAVAKAWDAVGVYGEDNPSAIHNISQEVADDNIWYDLQGRRIDKPVRGIYIKDGHKVVVK